MRIFTYNILNGGVGRADPVGEVIEAQQADVVILIEADDAWVTERIARRLKMAHVTGLGDKHAAAILSRFPVVHTINHAALNPAGPRSWLEARIQPPGEPPLHLMAVHLHPRATLADEQIRLGQIDTLLDQTSTWRNHGTPHVLAGDFNANAPQQRINPDECKQKTRMAYAANGNVIPRDAIAKLQAHGYVDSLAAVHGEAAFGQTTFTTHEPGQRVDYVFTHGITAREAWIEKDRLATYASDHYPIGVTLEPALPAGRA
ncbi:MAG: endonuclease/exonuclease/phosphatase family protein [Tepidisphaeraceae bacterium]